MSSVAKPSPQGNVSYGEIDFSQMKLVHPIVQERLDEFAFANEEAYAISRLASDEMRDLRSTRRVHAVELQNACDYSQRSGFQFEALSNLARVREIATRDKLVRDVLTSFDAVSERIRRREAANRPNDERRAAISTLMANLRSYVDGLALGLSTVPLEFEIVRRPAGDYGRLVEEVRSRIATLAADVRRVESAPVPSRQAKEVARAQIAQLANNGRPKVGALIEGAEEFEWPKVWSKSFPAAPTFVSDSAATLAWLFREQMIKAVEREIEAVADDENAIGDSDRRRQLATLAEGSLEAQRQEENLIRSAGAEGIVIIRRPDADPRAVLGFRLETRA